MYIDCTNSEAPHRPPSRQRYLDARTGVRAGCWSLGQETLLSGLECLDGPDHQLWETMNGVFCLDDLVQYNPWPLRGGREEGLELPAIHVMEGYFETSGSPPGGASRWARWQERLVEAWTCKLTV